MPDLSLNPEYAQTLEQALKLLDDQPKQKPRVGDVESRRTTIEASWPRLLSQLSPTSSVEKTHVANVSSYDAHEVALYRFSKKDTPSNEAGSAIVYIHGGAYLCLSVELYAPLLSTYVASSGVTIYAMDYRLSPEHPFPAPLEDCYTSLKYVHDNATQLGVDPARIAVMGDSAGGGLCAGVAILARNRDLPLAKQIIISGILDDRTVNTKSMPELASFATWTIEDNITAWVRTSMIMTSPACFASLLITYFSSAGCLSRPRARV